MNKHKYNQQYYQTHKEYHRRYGKEHRDERNKTNLKFLERNPGYMNHYYKQRIVFNGRTIILTSNPKSGICSNCGRSVVKGEIKLTNMHHYRYDEKDPLANTIELCVSCHRKEHARLRRNGIGED